MRERKMGLIQVGKEVGRMWGSRGKRKHNQNVVCKSKSTLCKKEVRKEQNKTNGVLNPQ